MSKSWIQHPITLELIPRNEYVRPKEVSSYIIGDIERFVSPLDGSVISDRRKYREHCERHGVVPAQDFTPDFLARRRAEIEGETNSKQASRERKQVLYESWVNAERQ